MRLFHVESPARRPDAGAALPAGKLDYPALTGNATQARVAGPAGANRG